jgi:sugar lactone lactonase YvrE
MKSSLSSDEMHWARTFVTLMMIVSQFKQLVARGSRLAAFLILLSPCVYSHPGIGIVMDSKQNVFYTDLVHVWKIDDSGKKSIAVRNVHTHELYIDDQDNLFGEHLWYNGEAVDTWGHYVWKLTSSGNLSKVVPDTEGFRKDYSFVHDHMGRMYHAQGPQSCQHIVRVNKDKSTSILGDQCLNNIRWMTASEQGQLYIIDGGNLMQLDLSGRVSTLAADVPKPKLTQFFVNKNHYLGGLATDKDQNVYVCDFSARNVKKISKTGKVTIAAETDLPWAPSGVLIDERNGDLWLLEYSIANEGRVERISPDGKRTGF